ncbi:ABC transporter transmembrane domain-containing protein, partial [Streptomyces coeruleorubidus]
MSIAETRTGTPAWRLLLGYVRPHRRSLLAGAVLSLVTGATGLMLPLVARGLIDDLAHDRAITGALLAMSALVVTNAAVGALGSYVLRRTAESVVLGARRSLSSYLLRLRITAVDRTEPGDLMARITSDTTLLRTVTTESLVGLGTGGLTLVATIVMMGLVDPVLLGVTVAVIAGAGAVIGTIAPRINKASKQAQQAVG